MNIISQETSQFIYEHTLIFIIILIWSITWKGIALWKSARLEHKWWFVIILIANTLAIVDLFYIFFISSKFKVETKEIK